MTDRHSNRTHCADRLTACSPRSRSDDLGGTATHELGHYLGLYHTFHSSAPGCTDESAGMSCSEQTPPGCYDTICDDTMCRGDAICDTKPQSCAVYDCASRGTCGRTEPVENYMGYSEDSCLTTFTEEQARRMRCSLTSFRSGIYDTVDEVLSPASPPSPPLPPTSPPSPPSPPTSPPPSPPPPCANTNGGAKDSYGTGCGYYADNPDDCGSLYDDSDFTANAMCCACGGGGPLSPSPPPSPPPPPCADKGKKCDQNKCESYSDKKKKQCKKTCDLCACVKGTLKRCNRKCMKTFKSCKKACTKSKKCKKECKQQKNECKKECKNNCN